MWSFCFTLLLERCCYPFVIAIVATDAVLMPAFPFPCTIKLVSNEKCCSHFQFYEARLLVLCFFIAAATVVAVAAENNSVLVVLIKVMWTQIHKLFFYIISVILSAIFKTNCYIVRWIIHWCVSPFTCGFESNQKNTSNFQRIYQ